MKNVEDIYPLSPVQQGMLFHALYDQKAGMYLEQKTCVLQGNLDVSAFERAWRRVVERHQVLRAAFVWQGLDEPVQVVRKEALLRWTREDWRELAPEEQQARLSAFLQSDRARGMELSKAPLMRMALFRLAEDAWRLVWTHHHLLMDGWSMAFVFKEIFLCYEAFHKGQDIQLERSRPFRDYIAWLQRQDMSKAEEFWRKELKGVTAPTPLRFGQDVNGSRDSGDVYGLEKRLLSATATDRLRSYAQQHGLTVNSLAQGAWALLLSHHSVEKEVIFGVTVSGRPAELHGIESMVGLFINTLPVRVKVSSDMPVVSWLEGIQARQVEMRQYEYSPLVQVQGWSDAPRGQPLFESYLVYENYPVDDALRKSNSELKIQDFRATQLGNYPLVLRAGLGAGLLLEVMYDRRRFDAGAIKQLLSHLEILVSSLAERPNARLGELDKILVEAEEKERVMKLKERKDAKLADFLSVKPKVVSVSQKELVRTSYLLPEQTLPLVMRPTVDDADLVDWVSANRDVIERELLNHGAILFRNWSLKSIGGFERFAEAAAGEGLMDYSYRSTPRSLVEGKVYTSTEYPADQFIPLHNEMAYSRAWPLKIAFYCVKAAERGGETPIADSRKVFAGIVPEIRERFMEKKVLYVRNYGGGLDLPWQKVFQTSSKSEVENFCRRAHIDFEWRDGDRLRTRQVCQAVAKHPKTGEMVWFNQAHLFHVSNLEAEVRAKFLAELKEEDLPRNSYYGDGAPIEPVALEAIRQAYQQQTITFPWREGDALLLDNMLTAHGRTPFAGSRKVVVAMAGATDSQSF